MCREMFPVVTDYLATHRLPLSTASEKTVMTQTLRFVLSKSYDPKHGDIANPSYTLTERQEAIIEQTLIYLQGMVDSTPTPTRHAVRQRYGIMRRAVAIRRSRRVRAA